jgi:tetratricopeptide (TPR) repeat protein
MTDQQVFTAFAVQPFTFLGTDSALAGVADLYPQMARPLAGRFALVGKLTNAEAGLTLNYGAGGKILSRSKLALARADAVEGDLLRRYWAQKKLDDLLVFQKRNEDPITELGKQYGLVTPFTSLMVLENLEQYVEHHIPPPASLPALRAAYARIMEQRAGNEKKENRQRIDQILALWQKRVEWWNRDFKYPEDFKARMPQNVTPLPGRAVTAPAAVATIPPDALPAASADSYALSDYTVSAPGPVGIGGAKASQATVARVAEPGIVIKEWDPKTPYLTALKQAPARSAFATYLSQRKQFAASPAFYLDCAEFFRRQKQDELAVQVLSNIAELELENAALLRVLAHRLQQIGQLDLACGLFEQILELRPEEPQSFRDLALALARRGQQRNDRADYLRALELLARVVNQQWDRFEEIEVIALMELNALWAECTRRFPGDKAAFPVDERLKKLLDLDLRIVLTWDADMTDIDLHVTEPSGEQALYSHNLTTIGGLVSRDFTQGYGPEEYGLRKAMHGTYKIEVNYFGSQASQLQGPVTVQAEVIAHFGRPNETRKSLTLRLEEKKETSLVGEVEF